MNADDLAVVRRYHQDTKHHFNHFARALGYLDWASQPRPFRSFDGAPVFGFGAPSGEPPGGAISYDRLLAAPPIEARPIDAGSLGHFLRYALGLSAWKVFRDSRWSLRANPSSGNLHPTEAYVIAGGIGRLAALDDDGSGDRQNANAGSVWHYAPDRHVIERRCAFAASAWQALQIGAPDDSVLVALTSIHWREAWKYGERAFRYCQHDLGHAVAALRVSAALLGWQVVILRGWSHDAVATIAGLDRDEDYLEAEREEPACLLLVTTATATRLPAADAAFVDAVRTGRWSGHASQLSEDHVQWTFIDEVAAATRDRGTAGAPGGRSLSPLPADATRRAAADREVDNGSGDDRGLDARALLLQRRSALALDGVSSIGRDAFLRILARLMPDAGAPWDALWWTPRIHLALFVHRVDGIEPGLYLLPRSPGAVPALRAALSSAFLWQPVTGTPPLWLLERGGFRARATRVSCDQEIAGDGFFSLAMLADFDASLSKHGAAFYRQLFWESGVVGQMLYLEAEAAGARGTGIGCFYDDAVHELLGLRDHAFQSLYHFTVGAPIEDSRLTTQAAY
jgi:SagB-type dehydrogenase family enzyme